MSTSLLKKCFAQVVMCLALSTSMVAFADDLKPEQSTKLDALIKTAEGWAKDPAIVAAIKDYNTTPRASTKSMTQDQWAKLTVMDPIVKEIRGNEAAKKLASYKSDQVSEAFLSGADGTKVAFIAKTSNWSHKGKPKHDEPMAGKTWKGKVEKDDSTGLQAIQFSVPVLDGGKAIGSLVIGVSVAKL